MKVRIKPLSEMIAELDEETKRSEEWRKAQGLPKTTYRPSLPIVTVFGKGEGNEVDE